MRIKGTWPEKMTFLQGFGLGFARPWNDMIPAAALRVDRGSSKFLADCVSHLSKAEPGLKNVYSPPLHKSATDMWKKASFSVRQDLDIFEKSVGIVVAEPTTEVLTGHLNNMDEVRDIDSEAFEEFWTFGEPGLRDALASTPSSLLLLSKSENTIAGFAIVGLAGTKAYLQRLAVRPQHRGRGHGSSLIRASLKWSAKNAVSSMVLNTQPNNPESHRLYTAEGFVHSPRALHLMGVDL